MYMFPVHRKTFSWTLAVHHRETGRTLDVLYPFHLEVTRIEYGLGVQAIPRILGSEYAPFLVCFDWSCFATEDGAVSALKIIYPLATSISASGVGRIIKDQESQLSSSLAL